MKKIEKFATCFISVFLGFLFFGAGMSKLFFEHRFPGLMGPVWLEEKLEPYGLALYARFIAISQVIIGYCLLTIKQKTPGAIMAIPLILNILMITISQHWQGTPAVVSVFLLMNLYLLHSDRHKLLPLIGLETGYKPQPSSALSHGIWLAGLAVCFASIPISFHFLTLSWLLITVGVGTGFVSLVYPKKKKGHC